MSLRRNERWKNDVDYTEQLDAADKAWLHLFIAAEYGGDRAAQSKLRYTKAARQAAGHSRYANRYDVFTAAAMTERLDYDSDRLAEAGKGTRRNA